MRGHQNRTKARRCVLVVLAILPFFETNTSAQSRLSPHDVLQRYCKMDASGKQLVPGGWLHLARMFVPKQELSGPVVVLFDRIEVIRDFSIGYPALDGHDRAKLKVRYSSLGEIDYRSITFSPSVAGQVEKDYSLLLTSKHYDIDSNGQQTVRKGPKTWRIEGSPLEPHITVDAAISYITQLRDKASTAEMNNNANKTLEALKRLRMKTP